MSTLVLIEQHLASYFKFWLNGQISEGMCHGQELFRKFRVFGAHRRAHAYSLGYALTQQGIAAAITCTGDRSVEPDEQQYTLWISLRTALSAVEALEVPTVTPSIVMGSPYS